MTPTLSYRGRFAPSPTGDLHFGSLVAAVGSYLDARAAGGAWLVRIEDVDETRTVKGAAARMIETLSAFGMESDEPVVYQSARKALYSDALQRLSDSGDAFPCHCSRSELGASVHNFCGDRAVATRAPAIRVRAPRIHLTFEDRMLGAQSQHLFSEVGDFVVLRADGFFAYQLAVVVDDEAQGITDVVRGTDLLDSTARQIYLQRLLGFPTPRYLHLPLVVDAAGEKLSKQLASAPVDPADPLPALQRALTFLDIGDLESMHHRNAGAMLHSAIESYHATRLPRVRSKPVQVP